MPDENNIESRRFFSKHSTEKTNEVKTMELSKKHGSMPAQSWIGRSDGENPRFVDYYSELRTWLQHAIIQAEKRKDSGKRDKLLTLLREL